MRRAAGAIALAAASACLATAPRATAASPASAPSASAPSTTSAASPVATDQAADDARAKAKRDDRAAEAPRFPASVDELSAPRLPPPFVLPELSHKAWDLSLGWLIGEASSAHARHNASMLALARATVEGDVFFRRRLYVGLTLPFASALSPDDATGSKTVAGNLEAHVRVAFPLPSWLAFGAVLGVVAPTSSYGRGTGAAAAATAASSLEPTDAVYFSANTFALRPAVDVRVLRGPFVIQVRQGIDVVVDTSLGRTVAGGRFLGHAGVRVRPDVELSLEATQAYSFDPRAPDSRRTAMTLGPGARFSFGAIDLGAAMLTSLFDPLSTDLERFVAARVSLVAHLD